MSEYQKFLFGSERQQSSGVSPSDKKGLDKSWFSPSAHSEIVGIDFGGGKMCYHCLYSGEEVTGIPLSQAIDAILSLPEGCSAHAESAHLSIPQTEESLAQPFNKSDLQRLYAGAEERGITLRLLPHQHTAKVREWSAIHSPKGFVDAEKTSDINDARAIAFYVANNNGISLRKPVTTFERAANRDYGILVRQRANLTLNMARVIGYEEDQFPFISALADQLLNRMATVDGFVNGKKVAFTLASLVAYEEGGEAFRFTYNGVAPGLNFFMRYVVMSSPFHYGGGVPRSNLMQHAFRPFLARFAKKRGVIVKDGGSYIRFGSYSEEQERVRVEAMKQFRREVSEAYRHLVELTAGFTPREVLKSPKKKKARRLEVRTL